MSILLRDVRYALRALAAAPAFTLAALLSLAIGIGANTAIFSIVDGLLLRPLPYKDAERLIILWNSSPGLNIAEDWFSTAQYFDIRNGHHGFEQVAIAIGGNYNLTGTGEPERVGTIRVSSSLLPMLGQRAVLGRLFVPDEDLPGRAATAVLSYGTWARRFGSDPGVLGKKIILNGVPYEIVGVMPRSFSLPREVMPTLDGAEQAEILLPLPLPANAAQNRDREDYNIMGKLKPGVSVQQAQAEMDTITARLRHDFPEVYPPNGGLTFRIVPLLEQVVGNVRRTLYLLLGAVGFVLLIACVNLANLQLSRGMARQKEIAVRAALGATRVRIVRQLLTENVLLAFAGGVLGIAVAFLALRLVQLLGPQSVPRVNNIGIGLAALLFTLIVCILSAILFGLAPAQRLSRINVQTALQDTGRTSAGVSAIWGRGNNLRRSLVIAEIALCAMLLIGAGLLIRSFVRVREVNPGFNPRNVLTLELTMTGERYQDKEAVLAAYHELWQRLERLPGVTAAGAITSLPLSQMFAWGPITVEGRVPPPGEKFINADIRVANGHYFQAMEIPLREGRLFSEDDLANKPGVAVVDDYMAQQLWPNQDPIGKRFHFGGINETDSPWITVVGVVGRVKQYTLDSDSRIALYVPQMQYRTRAMNVVMRSSNDPVALTRAVRQQIHELHPDLPLYNVSTMQERFDKSLARRRFTMLVLGTFAAISLGLATIGIYGLIAYLVGQGTREVGIRLALGATPANIKTLIIRGGMTLAFWGVGIGIAGALVVSRLMRSLLFGVGVTDVVTFIAVPALLASIAFLASYFPARRVSRIDPSTSLRCE
ncbi:ABC transporter permease [Alloacidobacterium sp.]|uniref:ABC transporter permease n=1 Tax=Alloacidobacterium sp. TaxID=2951999 RepID=UPI002D33915E|nr:ABC transporter permease [Alloacidobacterium sp.]HYK37222.1 ABC transporter permease [Alloacidobacterium sp.]